MKQVVDYAQNYYAKWLNHWGYPVKEVLPVDRDANGVPKIYYVRGAETAASGKYDKVGYQWAVREQAMAEHKIPRQGSTWWIFVYGTKIKASRGYGGFGDPKGNGWALLVWHDLPGEFNNDSPLAGGITDQINLKGYLHELGHTMNLAHFGPRDREVKAGLGMSLMGPNARTYRSLRRNRETKVHMTKATAAIIWKQPQITGEFPKAVARPQIRVSGFRASYDSRAKRIRVLGRLSSNIPAHSVVAIDMPDKGLGTYWKKAYAERLNRGRFDLSIDELDPSSGTLKVFFCFDNGYMTGTGKGYGYKHSIELPYRFETGRYRIGK
ncbi:MAG: hypothetical protein CMO80_18480 [Verrucomicrobiales bacterium]|nr:hypothetical protein [Verrucomicrobiales bacterium]|tara:strand:+ start:6119 stop:7090 length:972 start_codon:yes stop_codon:yes gene_type:complete